ncbi:MAG: NfeD family protein [Gammaproteobacteria bacterium]|nr:NfeD family protein [Gammaproteobacteria bacterium]
MDFLIDPIFYNWLILAAVLLIAEVATFTLIFVWLAIAAFIMAGISYFIPAISPTSQLWIYAILSVLSVIIWHRVFKKKQDNMGDKRMNNRAERYIGRTATLSEAISNGYGKIQIEDSFWRVSCDTDLPVGSNVEIIDADGVMLSVKPKA